MLLLRTMTFFPCPYLGSNVELTDEREHHITLRHPDLHTLMLPDEVRRSSRIRNARLLSRWFEWLRGGKYVVVVVVNNPVPAERHWIVTAYMTNRLTRGGDIEWKRT